MRPFAWNDSAGLVVFGISTTQGSLGLRAPQDPLKKLYFSRKTIDFWPHKFETYIPTFVSSKWRGCLLNDVHVMWVERSHSSRFLDLLGGCVSKLGRALKSMEIHGFFYHHSFLVNHFWWIWGSQIWTPKDMRQTLLAWLAQCPYAARQAFVGGQEVSFAIPMVSFQD